MFEIIKLAVRNGNVENLNRLITHIEVNENSRYYEEKFKIKTKLGKNSDPPLYICTLMAIPVLFIHAVRQKQSNILHCFKDRGNLDPVFWQEQERWLGLPKDQYIISDFKTSPEVLDLIGNLM
jgi:hypothetical protein